MEKYDVGIVGWWYNLNYGGTLTYYSLYKCIESMGLKALMIQKKEWSDSSEGTLQPAWLRCMKEELSDQFFADMTEDEAVCIMCVSIRHIEDVALERAWLYFAWKH